MKPPTDYVERFLSMLRFDSREKLKALGSYVDLEVTKIGVHQFESAYYIEIPNRSSKVFSFKN